MKVEKGEVAFAALTLAVFLILALYQLDLPGLHYDEAREAGVPAMRFLMGPPVDAFRGAQLHLFGRDFPLMVQDYIGAINVYLAVPFLAVLGINVPALRLMPIVLAAIALVLAYGFGRELYSRRVAAMACSLLAVNPSFVFWSRQGVFVTSTTVTISLAALWCWLRWYRGRPSRYLYGGAFLFGLGLYTKLLFVWIIGALAVTFIILNLGRRHIVVGRLRKRLPRGTVAWAAVAFLLGCAPFIAYNVWTAGTLMSVTGNIGSSFYGTRNLSFLSNLATRLGQFWTLLDTGHLWYLGRIFTDAFHPLFFFGTGLVAALVVLLLAKDEGRRVAFPFLMIALIIVQSCFTVSALWITHYAILTPWPPLAIAVSLDLIARRSRLGRTAWIVGVAVVVLLAANSVRLDMHYHRALAESRGYGHHSAAGYELASYLLGQGIYEPVAMDWGISAPVRFLTRDQVKPVEIFGYDWQPDDTFVREMEKYLGDINAVYIFHQPRETVFDRLETFNALVARTGRVSRTIEVIWQSNSQIYVVLVQTVDKH